MNKRYNGLCYLCGEELPKKFIKISTLPDYPIRMCSDQCKWEFAFKHGMFETIDSETITYQKGYVYGSVLSGRQEQERWRRVCKKYHKRKSIRRKV